jgi:hypothetical protein
MFFAR